MTQRDSTGIKTKTSVELVDDLRAADLSDLCDAAEIFESRLVSGGFGSLVSTLGSRGFDAVEGWPSWCWKPAKGAALNYCMLTIALLVVILL